MFAFIQSVLLSASLVSCSGAEGSGASGGGFGSTAFLLIMLVLMIGMFKEMLDALKPGDRVRTIGGIYGTVTSVKDDVVTISVGPDKVRLVFARAAIATIEDAPVEATIDGDVRDVK